MKRIIISGITGQDGYLLSNLLKKKKFSVLGLSRNKSKNKNILKTNYSKKSLEKIIDSFKPEEIYNFAGFTNPTESWNNPSENFFANFNITLNFLEILKKNKHIKFFNASSSEIFADDESLLNENSKIFPINPYGIAKSASYFLMNAYREKYQLFLINGILFNHESYRNKEKYLLKYLISSCKKIKEKKIKKIVVKDSRPIRDFGCAKEYVSYIFKLMQIKKPGDFIIASGKAYSVKQIVNIVRKKFHLPESNFNYENNFQFKNFSLSRKAQNKKLTKTLKLRAVKQLPDVVETMIKDLKYFKK